MKLLLLLICCKGLFNCCGNDNVNIPDANFKAYLVGDSAINTNGDKEIQVREASAFNDTIRCISMNISNLKGLEAFTALNYLNCSYNQLKSLDLSKNTTLTNLNCIDNQLTSLDVSKNTALTSLSCSDNQLKSLDLSKNTALTELYCNENHFDCDAMRSKYGID